MIGHDHEWTESVMAKLDAALYGIADGLGDFILAQKLRPTPSRVQLPVEPHKCLARGGLLRRRVATAGQTTMQMPGQEEPAVIGIHVR
jgi:hypothetical protein